MLIRSANKTRSRESAGNVALRIATLGAVSCFVSPAWGAPAEYPTKPIRLIVPFAPGGGLDVALRLLAPDLSQALGQQLVIDNRPGAGGLVGAEIGARALPDGYTLLGGSTSISSLPGLHKKLPFDPITDFAAITIAMTSTYYLLVHPSVAAASVKDLVALAKRTPGKLHYGSAGTGSTIHLAGEMLRTMAQIDLVHVPYRGAGPATSALVGGQIHLMFAPIGTSSPLVKAGKLRALAVTAPKRSALAPDTPTVAEAGLTGYQVSGWYGLLAPAGTPKRVISKLYTQTKQVLNTDAMKARLSANSIESLALSPDESFRFIKADTARWSSAIRDAGIPKE